MITLALVIFFLALAAFFSGSELAFVSCSRMKLRHMIELGDRNAQIVNELDKSTSRFLATILLGTNLAYVSSTVLFTNFMKTRYGIDNEFMITLILAPVTIIFAENIPKDFFRRKSDTVIYLVAKPLYVWFKLTSCIVGVVIKGSDFISKFFGLKISKKSPFVTKEEIRFILEGRMKTGDLRQHEKDLIDLVFDFEKIKAADVMIPKESLLFVESNESIGKLRELSRKRDLEYAVIYDEDPENVTGIVNIFDILFEEDDSQPVEMFLQSPLFFAIETSGRKVFQTLQAERRSVALVVDRAGKIFGMIRIEDLLLL